MELFLAALPQLCPPTSSPKKMLQFKTQPRGPNPNLSLLETFEMLVKIKDPSLGKNTRTFAYNGVWNLIRDLREGGIYCRAPGPSGSLFLSGWG